MNFKKIFPFIICTSLLIASVFYYHNKNMTEAKAYFLIGGVPILGYLLQFVAQRLWSLRQN